MLFQEDQFDEGVLSIGENIFDFLIRVLTVSKWFNGKQIPVHNMNKYAGGNQFSEV